MSRPLFIPRPLVRVNQWAIVVCVVLSWITRSPVWLFVPLLAGLSGLLLGLNPLMQLARPFLRRSLTEYAREDRTQQQFNQVIAVICLALGIVASVLHFPVLAYVFTAIVAAAAFVAILGFCMGCFIRFQWSQFRHRRAERSGRLHGLR